LSNGYFGGVSYLIPDKDNLIKGGHLATSFSFGMGRGEIAAISRWQRHHLTGQRHLTPSEALT
jgi:hypothetical protein